MAESSIPVRVGDVFHGYCGGFFGRDSYGDKRVEAVGADWVVVREDNGRPNFATFSKPGQLEEMVEKFGWRDPPIE